MTHGTQLAETDFVVDLNGEDCSTNVISRSVAKNHSKQVFRAVINGNNRCAGHSECDAIIMDEACVVAIPEIAANSVEASLIHEAAIGKIAGDQLIKLMTLGLTEAEAEEQIVNGENVADVQLVFFNPIRHLFNRAALVFKLYGIVHRQALA